MKIAHLSDLHIGYAATNRTNEKKINVRENDGYVALEKIVDQIIEQEVDCIVVAGDIFHSPTPSIRAMLVVQDQFRKLAKANIAVYSLAGNHDTNDIAGDIAASRIIHDEDRSIFSHVEPYIVHEIKPNVYLHMISHHMFSLQSDTMMKVKPVKGAINILTTHGSCIDPILEIQLKAEQSPREVVIPDFIIRDNSWDCIMLGHIHERGFVGADHSNERLDFNGVPILYNGSLIRRGFSDKEGTLGRGWTLWEITTKGQFTHEFFNVAQRPQFDLPIIDGSVLTTTDITENLVTNLEKAMQEITDFNIDTAPIVRQKFANVSPGQKASIQWPTIEKFKENMLSWQFNFVTTKDNKNNTKKEQTKNNTKGKKINSIIEDFDTWTKKDENTYKSLSGLEQNTKKQVLNYSREKVEKAHNQSLTEEE